LTETCRQRKTVGEQEAQGLRTSRAEALAAAKERKIEGPLAQGGPAGGSEDNEEVRSAIESAVQERPVKLMKGKKKKK
jgi:hypothetical protein